MYNDNLKYIFILYVWFILTGIWCCVRLLDDDNILVSYLSLQVGMHKIRLCTSPVPLATTWADFSSRETLCSSGHFHKETNVDFIYYSGEKLGLDNLGKQRHVGRIICEIREDVRGKLFNCTRVIRAVACNAF